MKAPPILTPVMPPWWDPFRPPETLKDGHIYRGKDDRWYTFDGVLVSRKGRRKAKV